MCDRTGRAVNGERGDGTPVDADRCGGARVGGQVLDVVGLAVPMRGGDAAPAAERACRVMASG